MAFEKLFANSKRYKDISELKMAMIEALKNHPDYPKNKESLTIGMTYHRTIILSLHHQDKRPTRYTLEIDNRQDVSMHIPHVTIDTIINEMSGHTSEKKKNMHPSTALSHFLHYAKQPADGNPENTFLNYKSMGVLEMKRAPYKPSMPTLNNTHEAAEAIRLMSHVVVSRNPVRLKEALLNAFNKGLNDAKLVSPPFIGIDAQWATFEDDEMSFSAARKSSLANDPFITEHPDASWVDGLKNTFSDVSEQLDNIRGVISRSHNSLYKSISERVIKSITSCIPEALEGIDVIIDEKNFADIAEKFEGIESSMIRAPSFVYQASPANFKQTAEYGSNYGSHVLMTMYEQGYAVSHENNKRTIIKAMRDTFLLYNEKPFSGDNVNEILTRLNQTPLMTFAIKEAIAQGLKNYSPEMVDAYVNDVRTAKYENNNKPAPTDKELMDDILSEIDSPDYIAQEELKSELLMERIIDFKDALPIIFVKMDDVDTLINIKNFLVNLSTDIEPDKALSLAMPESSFELTGDSYTDANSMGFSPLQKGISIDELEPITPAKRNLIENNQLVHVPNIHS